MNNFRLCTILTWPALAGHGLEVEKQHSAALTSAMLGDSRERKETRDEFLSNKNHSSI
jgi:hypothetical protein